MNWPSTGKRLILLACLLASTSFRSAAPSNTKRLENAVEFVMTKLMKEESGLYFGMPVTALPNVTKKSAHMLGCDYLSLDDTQYCPPGEWRGVFEIFVDDETESVKDLRVILLGEVEDKAALGKFVVAHGKKLGLNLSPDEDEDFVYWDENAVERDLWICLGDSTVVFEMLGTY